MNQHRKVLNDSKAGPAIFRPATRGPDPVSWVALPPRVTTWNVARIDILAIATVEADRLGGGANGLSSFDPVLTTIQTGAGALAAASQESRK